MPTANTININPNIKVGPSQKLLLIAGPCQIESLEHCLKIALALQKICSSRPLSLVFKSSFDKANRTSVKGERGPGIEKGLQILAKIKKETGLPLLTDIHDVEQAKLAAEVVDVLQIPAFLCRQTDLLIAAANTGKAINVKKGQFLHPSDMAHVASKIAMQGNNNIMLCERGACFGYRDLIVDMRSFMLMRQTGYPVIFDATHSVQVMGGANGQSSGQREFILPLARAAAAVGIDGLFVECHEAPERAPSDAASMLPLDQMERLLDSVLKVKFAAEQ